MPIAGVSVSSQRYKNGNGWVICPFSSCLLVISQIHSRRSDREETEEGIGMACLLHVLHPFISVSEDMAKTVDKWT